MRLQDGKNSNNAKKMYWTTGKGDRKNCDWKVSTSKKTKYKLNKIEYTCHLMQGFVFFADISKPNTGKTGLIKPAKP